MITWILPPMKPDVNRNDENDVLMGFSERCLCVIDDKLLGDPVTFGVYSHKLEQWIFEGYRSSDNRFKLKCWTPITKPDF